MGALTETEPGERAAREPPSDTYWLTRFLFLRLLGFIYLVAFIALARQVLPLMGTHGLLPADAFLERVREARGGGIAGFLTVPTLFWWGISDRLLQTLAGVGVGLSLLLFLGFANVPLLAALWFLYMSFVHVGQLFYGYGWEILLLETGFLAIFLAPLLRPWPFPAALPTPRPVVWLLRWLVFRLMLGAGLIKIRGDTCWRDLTCMFYHYETQPLPNPLSWYLHHLPGWIHRGEVLFNHFAELLVPWFVFAPARFRRLAGAVLVVFQIALILSGNLSFLNWLTITVCICCFDDGALLPLAPPPLRERVAALRNATTLPGARRVAVGILVAVVAFLSLNPVMNMLSPGQVMNTSFEPFELVNTYGAFGSIGRQRYEVILQGTYDATPGPEARWLDYEFPCKPGDVNRRPCVIAPYQPRLDWQIWFAAMSDIGSEPWLVHLVYKLLTNDQAVLSLLAQSPFRQGPPRWIRAELYLYEFTRPGEPTRAWWKRTRTAPYMPPVSADDPALLEFLERYGWLSRPSARAIGTSLSAPRRRSSAVVARPSGEPSTISTVRVSPG